MSQSKEVCVVPSQLLLARQLRLAVADPVKAAFRNLVHLAREAGATFVSIHAAEKLSFFSVHWDGKCLTNHQARFEVVSDLGLLPAVYAAQRLVIQTKEGDLAIRSEEFLEGKAFALDTTEPSESLYTWVSLHSLVRPLGQNEVQELAEGFPIDVWFNGEKLIRSDAQYLGAWVDRSIVKLNCGSALFGGFVAGEHGQYLLREHVYSGEPPRIYLNGVCVYGHDTGGLRGVGHLRKSLHNVVHLNPTHVFATLEGDRVIGEASMLDKVMGEMRSLYERRLVELKHTHYGVDFCCRAYDLARSLNRLDVFNDVDAVPASWLATVDSMPCSMGDGDTVLQPLDMASENVLRQLKAVTKADLEQGAYTLAWLTGFQAWNAGEFNQLAWILAYAKKALRITQMLHRDHWVHQFVSITDASIVEIDVQGQSVGKPIGDRAVGLRGIEVRLCDSAVLRCGSVSAHIRDVFFAPGASRLWQIQEDALSASGDSAAMCAQAEPVIFVPRVGDAYASAYAATAWQYARYESDGAIRQCEAEDDAREVNETVCALLGAEPEIAVRQSMERAQLRNHGLRGRTYQVHVGADGAVDVRQARG